MTGRGDRNTRDTLSHLQGQAKRLQGQGQEPGDTLTTGKRGDRGHRRRDKGRSQKCGDSEGTQNIFKGHSGDYVRGPSPKP